MRSVVDRTLICRSSLCDLALSAVLNNVRHKLEAFIRHSAELPFHNARMIMDFNVNSCCYAFGSAGRKSGCRSCAQSMSGPTERPIAKKATACFEMKQHPRKDA